MKKTTIIVATTLLAGCVAQSPILVDPDEVSSEPYERMNCEQLTLAFDEAETIFANANRAQLREMQEDAYQNIAWSFIPFVGLAAMAVQVDENKDKLAHAKGVVNAITKQARDKDCKDLYTRANILSIQTK